METGWRDKLMERGKRMQKGQWRLVGLKNEGNTSEQKSDGFLNVLISFLELGLMHYSKSRYCSS